MIIHLALPAMRRFSAVALFSVLVLDAACCCAQLSQSDVEYFADRIDTAADQLDVATVPSLDEFVDQVQAAIATVQQELRIAGDTANTSAWLGYLKLNELSDALAAVQQAPSDPTSRDEARTQMLALAQLDKVLGDMRLRLTINYPGLERAQIPRLRTAVRQLDAMLRHRDPQRSIEYVATQMADASKTLRAADTTTAADVFYQLDELTRLLIETRQAPLLVADIRGRFVNSNLRIGVGSNLISRIATRPFQEPTAINECLLGTFIRGRATLTGTVTTCLLPSEGVAKIQLILSGDLTSQNRGYRKPVTVDAVGYGHVTATKVLNLNDAGIHAEPAVASAQLSSKIQRVNHPLKIVRRIAMKKALEQKGATNAEGSRRMERRVAENFDRQTDQTAPLGDGKSTPLRDLVDVLGRLGVDEPSRVWSSETRYLLTTLRQRTDDDLAAAVPPPSVAGSHDLSVQIHESLINNVMTRILAGRTMTGSQLRQLGKSLLPELQFAADQSDEAEEPIITFSRTRPIIFEARQGKVWIGLRGTRFQQGDQSLKMPLRVRAEYLPTFVQGHGFVLQRQGEVEIDFPGTQRLSIGQIATRKKMERVFDRSLPMQLLDKPIRVPVKQLPESGIRVQEISAQQGWLSLGMR
ncbi:hypothetical protein [Rosistilla oblonga]|uniref:hypothetical protein n=1 Tax=Rosistilla oblonga TaxID=2527990 RepID=UPI0011A792E0|nr:hypothetical protein [Rosistilla oblonga]